MLSAPEPLGHHHQIAAFESGVPSLDEWLKRRAAQNQASGASRTFVVCEGKDVAGYYALASSAVAPAAAPGRFRRNMPGPDSGGGTRAPGCSALSPRSWPRPSTVSGRRSPRHPCGRSNRHSRPLVHALSGEAKAFYLGLGLEESPLEPMTLMCTIADLRAALGE